MLENHPHEALDHLKNYDATTQDFFIRLLPAMARLTQKPLDQMNPEEVAVLQDQLEALLETLRPHADLVINKMCFCEWIKAFGVYKPLPAGHVFQGGTKIRPGELVQVYVELRNFACEKRDPYHETLLSSYVEIRDVQNPKGSPTWKYRFDDSKLPVRSRARLHDFFNNYSFYVPDIPPGRYILTIQVTDETRPEKRRLARESLEFQVTAMPKNDK